MLQGRPRRRIVLLLSCRHVVVVASRRHRVVDALPCCGVVTFWLVMPRFFSGSFFVWFIQKAFFAQILRSWNRQVGKE
jgi:hypothetical protein